MCDKFQLDAELTVLGDSVKCCGSPAEGDPRCLETLSRWHQSGRSKGE